MAASSGLAICRELVERMGGRIEVESVTGEGTVFRFTLPWHAAPELPPRPCGRWRSTPTSAVACPSRSSSPTTTPSTRRSPSASWRVCAADVAKDGLEVLQAFEGRRYDLVFMDVQMPEMDGLEATREIRRREIPQPRIVAMTAHVLDGDREACFAAGMDDFLRKPVTVAAMQEVVERWGEDVKSQPH